MTHEIKDKLKKVDILLDIVSEIQRLINVRGMSKSIYDIIRTQQYYP